MTALGKIQTTLELLASSNFPDPYFQAIKSTGCANRPASCWNEMQENSNVYNERSWF